MDGNIAIIGGGLAAIYSYWGCIYAGYHPQDIAVFTANNGNKQGAVFMYLSMIPFPSVIVTSILAGTCDLYGEKQWAMGKRLTSAHRRFNNGDSPIVVESLIDPDEVVNTIWSTIPNITRSSNFTEEKIAAFKKKYKAVICTFANSARTMEYRNELVTFPISECTNSGTNYMVIYNGEPWIPWVRQTLKPGKIYTEYPYYMEFEDVRNYESDRGIWSGSVFTAKDIKPGTDPLTTEERREDNLLRVGRMATFDRGYLAHQAAKEVAAFLETL